MTDTSLIDVHKSSYHVISARKKWAVWRGGGKRRSRIFDDKESAVEWADHRAQKARVALYVHDEGGRIREKRDYE